MHIPLEDWPDKPFEALRGQRLFRNTGELSFETRPREAGTFPVTFLEWVPSPDWETRQMSIMAGATGGNPYSPWYARIVNQSGKIEAEHPTLVSRLNV